ncbi:GntR family transcriptional regulator [Halomonas cerina]|uniref:GntR family transcriptional regulator of vanillate catabolism n=1 Tax=Halomonas cerina TaxID=447424 RepID=A0A839VG76_9GAMM|nr:GntR family transcriptional regulator [Halomonas cerina]MBB3192339.1 GntR family transcriptional regulator of vanillate catabolism [Halomonas cerina]
MTSSRNVVSQLRKLISDGLYQPGERIGEVQVAEQLGVSRTPVRLAFRTLEQEGLLERAGKRGFQVREFTETDVRCAVEVRGVLEGLAARRLAEQGIASELDAELAFWIQKGRELLAKGYLVEADIEGWSELNRHFHEAIVKAAGSPVIGDAIARNNHLPFAAADSIIIDRQALEQEYRKLHQAQLQHELVVQALRQGEGARAEMLMREHAFIGLRYAELLG